MDSPTPPIVIDDPNGSAMDACFTAFDKDGWVSDWVNDRISRFPIFDIFFVIKKSAKMDTKISEKYKKIFNQY